MFFIVTLLLVSNPAFASTETELVDLQTLIYYVSLFIAAAMGFNKGGQR